MTTTFRQMHLQRAIPDGSRPLRRYAARIRRSASAAFALAFAVACGSAEPVPTPELPAEAQSPSPDCAEPYECALREERLTSCASDDECVVISRDCCACDPGHVAVRAGAEGAYYRRTCGEVPTCSPCQRHDVPTSLVGRCVEGRCAVAVVDPPEPLHCSPECGPVDQARCQPDREPCTCGYLHQPFADCEPSPEQPCPSARAFTVACDRRCCPD